MRMLLIAVTAIAILSAIASYFADSRVALLLGVFVAATLMSAAPVCLGALALYTRGHRQTFFLGAFVGSLAPLLNGWRAGSVGLFDSALLIVMNLATAAASGYLALITRRFAERRGWNLPPKTDDSESAD